MEAPTVSENNSDGVRVRLAQERREEKEEQRTEDPKSAAPTHPTTSGISRPNGGMEEESPQGDESTMRQQEASSSSACPKASTASGNGGDDEKANPTFLLTQAAHISETTSATAAPTTTVTAAPNLVTTSSTAPEILQRSPPKVTPISAAIESPASPPSSAPTTPSSTIAPSPAKIGVATTPSAVDVPRKRGVPHIYRDYSAVPDTIGYVRKKTGGVTQPFPEKLHELLERENEPTVISWLPHGRAFLVRKPKEFTQDVMPRYFRQTKLTSFQRQLNLYGFRRITQGADAGAYYHELFLRGRPQLCMRMRRQKVKGTGHKQPADAQTEPNFYAMPPSQAQDELLAAEPSSTNLAPAVTQHPPQQVVHEERLAHPEMSPGLQGVHGAAQLLKGIAAGLPASSLSSSAPFSLGVSAAPPRYASGSAYYQASSTTPAQQPTLVTFTHPPSGQQVLPQPSSYRTTTNHAAASFLAHVAAGGAPSTAASSAAPSSGLWSNLATSTKAPSYGDKGSSSNQPRTPHGFLTGDEGIEGATNTEAV